METDTQSRKSSSENSDSSGDEAKVIPNDQSVVDTCKSFTSASGLAKISLRRDTLFTWMKNVRRPVDRVFNDNDYKGLRLTCK